MVVHAVAVGQVMKHRKAIALTAVALVAAPMMLITLLVADADQIMLDCTGVDGIDAPSHLEERVEPLSEVASGADETGDQIDTEQLPPTEEELELSAANQQTFGVYSIGFTQLTQTLTEVPPAESPTTETPEIENQTAPNSETETEPATNSDVEEIADSEDLLLYDGKRFVDDGGVAYSTAQITLAAQVVGIVKNHPILAQFTLPERQRAAIIVVATVAQESSFENKTYGDESWNPGTTSVGILQQQNFAPWVKEGEDPDVRMDMTHAITTFFEEMLRYYPSAEWTTEKPGAVAYKVQKPRIDFKDEYDNDIENRRKIVDKFWGLVVCGPTALASGDVVQIEGTGIKVDSSIHDQVRRLIDDAEKDGFYLDGWGWRDAESQRRLRYQNCSNVSYPPDPKKVSAARQYEIETEIRSGACSPPTAAVGRSQHQKGLAVDLTYSTTPNGKKTSINSTSLPVYQWLEARENRYGLRVLRNSQTNEVIEPWHWSTTGK